MIISFFYIDYSVDRTQCVKIEIKNSTQSKKCKELDQ